VLAIKRASTPSPSTSILVLGSDQNDVLTEVRPLQTTPTETIAQDRSAKLETIDPIATFANWLALVIPGNLEEFSSSSRERTRRGGINVG
jgi:hypothetical protein